MRLIKRLIINYLSKYFILREPLKYDVINPFGITLGSGSYFKPPKQINGGKYITVGDYSIIGHSAWLGAFDYYYKQTFFPKLIIGDNVNIGNYACITCINEVIIEDGCLISEFVYISDHYHGYDPKSNIEPAKQPLYTKGRVIIGKNTFIGYRVSILSGVTLGRNCVVGAHSIVTKSFPDYSMIAGTPARLIKTYDFEKGDWILAF
jgi:acetyltransferase-like isoleucine patch superfamily enzyme